MLPVLISLLLLTKPPDHLAPPIEKDGFVVPAAGDASEPVWGVKDGISVGLWPTGGPRGLLRVYTPYLGQRRLRTLNFIAVEPVAGGKRGFSELEHSDLDDANGKAMWTSDEMAESPEPRPPWQPAAGKRLKIGQANALTFFVYVEPFKNGARPVVQVTLRDDRPFEISLKVFAAKGSAAMKSCVLTATMGNYQRLRKLWLKDEVLTPDGVWPDYKSEWAFAPSRDWPLDRLHVSGGEALVAATSDEKDPASAEYAEDVPKGWRFEGKPATQYWRTAAVRNLVVRVNARRVYWGGKGEIPGGPAFENFELVAPFAAGQEFVFGVTLDPPEKLGLKGR